MQKVKGKLWSLGQESRLSDFSFSLTMPLEGTITETKNVPVCHPTPAPALQQNQCPWNDAVSQQLLVLVLFTSARKRPIPSSKVSKHKRGEGGRAALTPEQAGERDSAQNILRCTETLPIGLVNILPYPVKTGEYEVSKGKGIVSRKHIRYHYRHDFLKRAHVSKPCRGGTAGVQPRGGFPGFLLGKGEA